MAFLKINMRRKKFIDKCILRGKKDKILETQRKVLKSISLDSGNRFLAMDEGIDKNRGKM